MNNHKAKKTLPDEYSLLRNLNLKDKKKSLILTVSSVVLLILSGFAFSWLIQWLRPGVSTDDLIPTYRITGVSDIIVLSLVIFVITFTMIIVHEAIHGIFFWVFTRGRVKFALKWTHAYAAAPNWYLPKRPYMVVSLAPLVLMTIIGVLVSIWVPVNWVFPIILLLALNAGGAVGDIYVFFLMTRMEDDVFIQDFGDEMKIFAAGVEAAVE